MRLRRVGLQRQIDPQILFRSEFHHITGTAIFMWMTIYFSPCFWLTEHGVPCFFIYKGHSNSRYHWQLGTNAFRVVPAVSSVCGSYEGMRIRLHYKNNHPYATRVY